MKLKSDLFYSLTSHGSFAILQLPFSIFVTPTLCCSWHRFLRVACIQSNCAGCKNIRWSRSCDQRSACGASFQFCYFGLFGSNRPTLKKYREYAGGQLFPPMSDVKASGCERHPLIEIFQGGNPLVRALCSSHWVLYSLKSPHNFNWRYIYHTSSCSSILQAQLSRAPVCLKTLVNCIYHCILPSSTSSCFTIFQAQLSRTSGSQ